MAHRNIYGCGTGPSAHRIASFSAGDSHSSGDGSRALDIRFGQSRGGGRFLHARPQSLHEKRFIVMELIVNPTMLNANAAARPVFLSLELKNAVIMYRKITTASRQVPEGDYSPMCRQQNSTPIKIGTFQHE